MLNGVLVGVIVLAAAAGGLWLWRPWQSASAATSGTLLTTTVKTGTVSATITASGSVSPARQVRETFGVSGTIATVDVAVGQTVAAGQQLGTVDTTDLASTLSNAETSYTYAKQNLAAAQTPTTTTGPNGQPTTSSPSVSQVNSAKQSLAEAAAALTTARANLAKATLTASVAGVVIAVNGEVGGSASGGSASGDTGAGTSSGSASGAGAGTSASASTSSAFVTIADVSSYTVAASITEADIADVSVGQAATITFPARRDGATAKATVTAIAPTATSSNSVVSYATTITLQDPPANLRLGQTADIAITTATSDPDALYVPAAAITTANGTSTIKVLDTATQKQRTVTVTTGVVGDDGTEITKGAKAGETVVLGTASTATGSAGGTTGATNGRLNGGSGRSGGFGGGPGFGGPGFGGGQGAPDGAP